MPSLHFTNDCNRHLYVFTYNDRKVMTEEDDPSPDGGQTPGPVWHWVHDATGALTETIDPMNRVTQLVRDGDSKGRKKGRKKLPFGN